MDNIGTICHDMVFTLVNIQAIILLFISAMLFIICIATQLAPIK